MQGILHSKNDRSLRFSRGLLAGLLVLTGLSEAHASIAITPKNNLIIYQIDIEGVEVGKINVWGEEFSKVSLKGVEGYEGVVYDVGRPGVPVVRFYVEGEGEIIVLPGADFEEMEKAENLLYPFQKSLAKVRGGPTAFFFNKAAYDEDEFSPKKAYDVESAGSWRGVKRRLVTLYPYFYKPSTGEQKYRKEFTVMVGKDTSVAAPVASREAVLFIAGSEFKDSPSLLQYIGLKREVGYEVFAEYVNDDDLKTSFQIRAKIQQYYRRKDTALKFVVIVGDVQQVPAHRAESLNIPDAVTDHFYRAIDTDDYNADIAGPDVGVGRISVENEEQLRVVLEKYSRYQLGIFRDSRWMKKASFIATDDEDHNSTAEETHEFVINNYTSMQKYFGTFPDAETAAGGDRLFAIKHQAKDGDLISALNEGRGIFNYSGHGTFKEWEGPAFTAKDLDKITSVDSMPMVVSNACDTAQFHVGESFGEAWQRHPKGGVFFWGSMDKSFWHEDDRLERSMYEQIFVRSQKNFAAITNSSLAEVWRYYGGEGRSKYYWETYVSLGDPSLEIRTEKPAQAFILGPGKIRRNSSRIDLQVVNFLRQPLAFVTVSLTEEGSNFHAVGKTDQNGHISFAIDPKLARWGRQFVANLYGNNIATSSSTFSVGFWR
jgi:hypothetical protein